MVHLTSAVWKCFKHAKVFLDKAFSSSNIQSAFESTGVVMRGNGFNISSKCNNIIYTLGTGKCDPLVILGKCPWFQQICQDDCDFLVSKLPDF